MSTILLEQSILLAGIIGFMLLIFINRTFDKEITTLFMCLDVLLFVLLIAEVAEFYYMNLDTFHIGRVITSSIGYIGRPLALLFVFAIINRKEKLGVLMKLSIAAMVIEAVVMTSGFFTHIGCWFDENNYFHRNIVGYLPYFLSGVYMVLIIYYSVKWSIKRKWQETLIIFFVIGITTIATIIETKTTLKFLLISAMLISITFYYTYLYTQERVEHIEREHQLKQELQDGKMKIMMSQIQPHFLYNALSSIQNLCHNTAPEAEKAVFEFAKFLRGNIDLLSATDTISFEQELKHTQYYLSLEQRRFKERLNVISNIQTTDFRIPALSLQPIVENAVRYGICQREDGGTIWITVKEEGAEYLIIVEDNGVGMDVTIPKSDGRTHIGISNTRNRLVKMCGGDLLIKSTPNVGTTAIIRIPKDGK